MKIVSTFVEGIFAIKEGQENSLTRVLREWRSVEWLYRFYSQNKNDIKDLSQDEFVDLIINDANEIDDILLAHSEGGEPLWEHFFKQLNNQEYQYKILSLRKGRRNFLRLYAIKIADNCYLITGGVIKLTQLINSREHTLKELRKLESTKFYLQSQSVFDEESFYEFINETI